MLKQQPHRAYCSEVSRDGSDVGVKDDEVLKQQPHRAYCSEVSRDGSDVGVKDDEV